MTDLPQSLLEAVRYFSDLSVCNELMTSLKWPAGEVICPHCSGNRCVVRYDGKRLRCKDCRKECSYKSGTIFEDSPLGLDKWFVAVWCIANCKNGISSHELARALGVTQKSAWFMLHRIREAMRTGTFTKLRGTVESDETFIGGKADNMHPHKREKKIKGRGAIGKAIVQGVLERGGEVRATVVKSTDGNVLCHTVRKHVEPGATVYTDSHAGYSELCFTHPHATIDHAVKYVEGLVHVNGVENFWSLFKRCIKGTYVSIAPYHLQRYADEEAFRYNQRHGNDASRFARVMQSVIGRRVTWRHLTAQDDAGFMGLT